MNYQHIKSSKGLKKIVIQDFEYLCPSLVKILAGQETYCAALRKKSREYWRLQEICVLVKNIVLGGFNASISKILARKMCGCCH